MAHMSNTVLIVKCLESLAHQLGIQSGESFGSIIIALFSISLIKERPQNAHKAVW